MGRLLWKLSSVELLNEWFNGIFIYLSIGINIITAVSWIIEVSNVICNYDVISYNPFHPYEVG